MDKKMILNEMGKIVDEEWRKTAVMRTEINLDVFVIMPNHLHGIIEIIDHINGRTGNRPIAPTIPKTGLIDHGPPAGSLGAIMAGFKSAVTVRINKYRKTPGARVWQRNYWEHVVRNEYELNNIREYIRNNPSEWDSDAENTQ